MYYGTHAAPSAGLALYQLMVATAKRIRSSPMPPDCAVGRFPVALFFVRGDRGGDGKKLAEQVVASFDYWDRDTGDSLDVVLAGWSKKDGELAFDAGDFLKFRKCIETSSKWKYSGETDLLLLNFEVDTANVEGWFDYSEAIALPLEEMLRNKQIGSIDGLLAELARSAEQVATKNRYEGTSPVWEISDRAGILRVKKDLWCAIKKLFLKDYAEKLDGLEQFAVKDMQGSASPFLKLPFDQMREVRAMLISSAAPG
jgi:hypothetical protein